MLETKSKKGEGLPENFRIAVSIITSAIFVSLLWHFFSIHPLTVLVQDQENQIRKLNGLLIQSNAERDNYASVSEELEKRAKELKEEHRMAKHSANKCKEEKKKLEDELTVNSEKFNGCNHKYKILRDEKEKLETEMMEERAGRINAERRGEECALQLEGERQFNDELSQSNENMRQSLKKAQEDSLYWEGISRQAKNQIGDLLQEAEQLRDDLASCRRAELNLQAEVLLLNQDNGKLVQQIAELEADIPDEREMAALQAQIAALMEKAQAKTKAEKIARISTKLQDEQKPLAFEKPFEFGKGVAENEQGKLYDADDEDAERKEDHAIQRPEEQRRQELYDDDDVDLMENANENENIDD